MIDMFEMLFTGFLVGEPIFVTDFPFLVTVFENDTDFVNDGRFDTNRNDLSGFLQEKRDIRYLLEPGGRC